MINTINETLVTPRKYECDVCVCGGGVAGIAAALAAKRIVGDTVALIEEERPFFLALLAHSRHGGSFLPLLSG